jgi:hypothetical protein
MSNSTSDSTFIYTLNSAKNLARQTIEDLNGGLEAYRAEGSMHGDAQYSPYVANSDGSYTFTFKGREPSSVDFTYESQVTVSPDGSVVVNYNGVPRSSRNSNFSSTLAIDANQAKNMARQAAENANGGLGNYRAENSMHGKVEAAPYVENADGSYTFTFKGRHPESLDFTYESEVTVQPDGAVEINYNGAPRSVAASMGDRTVPMDANQAKNLARQAAENANGGLGNYRAEASMHGDFQDSPYVENADGSYTFTFRGRHPEALDFTYRSVVTVFPDGTVRLDEN